MPVMLSVLLILKHFQTVYIESDSSYSPRDNTFNVTTFERWTEPDSPSPTVNNMEALNVTDSEEELLDLIMQLESVSFNEDEGHSTFNDSNTDNVTQVPAILLKAPPDVDQVLTESETITPHPLDDSRDALTVTDSEELLDRKRQLESVSINEDEGHSTFNDSNTDNVTQVPAILLKAPPDVDQVLTESGTITPHPLDDSRDTLTVTDSEELLNTKKETELVSFHQDDSHNINNETNTENVTEAPRKSLTAPVSVDLPPKRDVHKNSGKECIIKTIKCKEKVTKMQSTFGAWLTDAAWPNQSRYWVADHFSGRVLVEYRNHSAFQSRSSSTIDVGKYYQGCGHVVYNKSFYFHKAGTNRLIKFDLNTGKANSLIMENSRYCNLNYLFPNSKTYFKFAVDENGLWVIFASDTGDQTMVAKLNSTTFSVESVVNTLYPTTKAGNAFITCGVLYFTDDSDRIVTYAFDLKKEVALNASFDLRPANGILAMLSYNPSKKLLYMWDNSSVKTCRVITSK
uniref:Olfactomedin-like domain-containing protein n=1 Tax=Anabas testudineus TaxID=64144 RepID=A0A3Q1IKI6_ANATE